jgi:hypothetical protein
MVVNNGQRYNPYKMFHGSFIPDWLSKRQDLGAGAKMVFARLARYAGDDGYCYPSYKTIADEIGMARITVIKAVGQLVEKGLLQVESGMQIGKANRYFFLWDDDFVQVKEGGQESIPPRSEKYMGGGQESIPKENQEVESITKNNAEPVFVVDPDAKQLRDRIAKEVLSCAARTLQISDSQVRIIQTYRFPLPKTMTHNDVVDEINKVMERIKKNCSWNYIIGTPDAPGILGNIINQHLAKKEEKAEQDKRTKIVRTEKEMMRLAAIRKAVKAQKESHA